MSYRSLTRYSLKWNPFSPEVPVEACYADQRTEHFIWRVRKLSEEGGFAMVTGESGTGKSITLRMLKAALADQRDAMVGVLTRPQSSLSDFYRELGSLYNVQLTPHNRWAGTTVLRQRWLSQIETGLSRAILIVDEAQEMQPAVLKELRLLSADALDSRFLLTVVLGGDQRLVQKFRKPELIPLAGRIRVQLHREPATPDQLREYLQQVLAAAGNPHLMTEDLVATVCEHAAGNLRVLMTMCGELLDAAVGKKAESIDEELFLETFASPGAMAKNP